MKQKIKFSILLVLSLFLFQSKLVRGSSSTINLADSVVFDLSQAVINGNNIDIPVSILSDDTIFALDFSMKFNHLNLTFDTILNPTLYITSFYYYNPADSTLRFTSYSMHQYANDSPLVVIRFTMLNTMIAGPDLYDMFSYLNGDTCSTKYIDLLPTGIRSLVQSSDRISMYPNPANHFVTISSFEGDGIEVFDISGRLAFSIDKSDSEQRIDISGLPNGVYAIKTKNRQKRAISMKLLVEH